MDKKTRQRRDRLQNLLIVLLSVSAMFLFSLTQSELLHWDLLPVAPSLSGGSQESPSAGTSRLQELDWPVTTVICDSAGDRRYQQLTTSDSAFTAVEGLWEDALRQITSSAETSYEEFERALGLPGLYTAFPSPVPACILSARLGLASDNETPLQSLLLAADSEEVRLLFSTGKQYFLCTTALTPEELTGLAESLGGEPCLFAFEQEETTLHPLTVLPGTLPQHRTLSAAPLPGGAVTEDLLTYFGFNAHTTSRYTEASGTEVIMESPRRLSVSAAGLITYTGTTSYAPESFRLSDSAAPTLSELVGGAYGLLLQLPGLHAGEERLYLSHAEYSRAEDLCTLYFSYMVHGLPLACSDGSAAAEVTVTDGIVTAVTVLRRSYTATDSLSLLLPVAQASAIAANHPGLEMALSYVDNGSANLSAAWLMR